MRCPQHGEAQRFEDVGPEAAVADRERADRVPVVRTAECEKGPTRLAAVAPVLPRDLERLFDGSRAV